MNLKDRMKQDEKPTVQDPQNSISTIEKSKLLEEQSNQIRALMTQNGNLKDTLQQSEAERQRITSENLGLRKELQRKSAEIVKLNERIGTLRESDKILNVAEQKLKELQQKEKELSDRECSLKTSAGIVDNQQKKLASQEQTIREKKNNIDAEIKKEAEKRATVLAADKVAMAEKKEKEAKEEKKNAEKNRNAAWMITAIALSAVIVRSEPLFGDLWISCKVIYKLCGIYFALAPAAYRWIAAAVAGWGGIALGVVGFLVVVAIGLAVSGFILFQIVKFIFFHSRSFLFIGVGLVYLQGVIKDVKPIWNLIVVWIVIYVVYEIAVFFINDYIKIKNDSY